MIWPGASPSQDRRRRCGSERSGELSESSAANALNAIYAELEQLDAEINQPVCRPQHEIEALQQRAQMLTFERDLRAEAAGRAVMCFCPE